jgi:uncharacterized protein (DUF4415 family)
LGEGSAGPVLDAISEIFGTQAAETIRRRAGRPEKAERKVNQTLRLDPDVLNAYKQEGPGWQTHMNAVLREHMPRHETRPLERFGDAKMEASRSGAPRGRR